MANSFTIKQDLSLKEFFNAFLYIFFTSRIFKRLLLFMSIISGLGIILDFLTDSKKPLFVNIALSLLPLIFLFSFFFVFGFLATLFIYKTKTKLFKNVTYEFTHWGVMMSTEGADFSKPWREFIKIRESRLFFLLYISANDAYIIKKGIFENNEEIKNFRDFLKLNIA
jgi:hypothetical protein